MNEWMKWNSSLSKLQKQRWVFPDSRRVSVLVLKQLLFVQPSSSKTHGTSLEQPFNEQLDGAKWWENQGKFHQKPNYMSCKLWWVTLVATLQACGCCCCWRSCSLLLLLLLEASRRSCCSFTLLSLNEWRWEKKILYLCTPRCSSASSHSLTAATTTSAALDLLSCSPSRTSV